MIHHLLFSLVLIVAIVLCPGVARPQQNTPARSQQNTSTAENAQTAHAALREKAFKLLESLAGELNTLQSGENRARLGSNIAESIWNHDEQRARKLFISVEEDIQAGLQNPTDDDPRDHQTLMVFIHLRKDTVERIAKHDAELAYEFLKATELASDKERPYAVVEAEREIALRLARQIAANSPDLALKLGRKSLARGFDTDLLPVLKYLLRKHRDQGETLYKETIIKLREAKVGDDWTATYFARVLADYLTPPDVNESAYRDLINIFITSAIAKGCDKSSKNETADICSLVTSLWHRMEKFDPLRAAQLKRWAPSSEAPQSSYSAYEELHDLTQNGTVDEMLTLAAKYPQIAGDIEWRAVMKAQKSGDLERARKIATDYDGDPEFKKRMLEQIERDQMWRSLNEEQIAELQNNLPKIPIKERVMVLLAVANRIGENDRKTALMLLEQASAMIDTIKADKQQTQAQIFVAMMYCSEKSDRGLAIMGSLMPKLNELISSGAKLDGYDNQYLRDGEWSMTSEGGLGDLLTWMAKNAASFAWCDFDRAVSLAAQFERPEIRLMAQLKLAQGILAGPPKRTFMTQELITLH